MTNAQANGQALVMTFDDEGDLRLEVGEQKARRFFMVCSRSLARVSRPFKAMLYGGFAESTSERDPNWTIELPEDDPQTFITILHIVHSQFGMIPENITRDQLYQITILTDKYDMTEILRPWARNWLSHAHSTCSIYQGDEVLTWIAWELGDRSLFVAKAQWMLDNCHLDGSYNLCCSDGNPLQNNVYIASINILEQIIAKRAEGLAAMCSQVQNALDDYIRTVPPIFAGQFTSRCKVFGAYNQNGKECQTFYLGSLIQALYTKGYYPLPTPTAYMGSLTNYRLLLLDCLSGIKPPSANFCGHDNCSPQNLIKSGLLAIAPEVALTEAQEKHLSRQALRSGIAVQK